jgi:chromosome segregation ATPase
LEDRLLKMQNEFKSFQQKFQYTYEDMLTRDNKITQLEYDLEESMNQSKLIKLQNQELLNVNENLKVDYDELIEQKRNCEKEITRLEGNISEIQMNFTSVHQQLKKEIARLEANSVNLNNQIEQSELQTVSLTNQIGFLNENAKKLELQIETYVQDLQLKSEELEGLKTNIRSLNETNLELEKINMEKENLVIMPSLLTIYN